MSILLEALRKSEKNHQPVSPPSIHSEEQHGPVSESIRTGPLALLLVGALLVIGWLIWNQYKPSAGIYQPPVSLPEGKVTISTAPVAEPGADETKSTDKQVSRPQAGQPRTPVESYQPPSRVAAKPATETSNSNSTKPGSKTAGQANVTAKVPARQAKAIQENTDRTAAAGNARKAGRQQSEFKPQEPAPISYWELPDSVRADVPEIKFSVLVYASDPADRFVLVNGQRLKEGDSYQSGMLVEEIQRDGVVFSYRLYRFIVER